MRWDLAAAMRGLMIGRQADAGASEKDKDRCAEVSDAARRKQLLAARQPKESGGHPEILWVLVALVLRHGRRYWARTSDLCRVKRK